MFYKIWHFQVHILESHVVEFLRSKGEKHGMGFYSEQAMESMHYELREEWGVQKLDINHPNYGDKLKGVVARINGKHI